MRILVVGDWHSELHEAAVHQAFRTLGHDVSRFSWHEYFHVGNGWGRGWEDIVKRAQNKFVFGPLLTRINRDFIACVDSLRPDIVFVYRGTHITAESLHIVKVRHPSCILVGYNNDDPFAPAHPRWLWRHFLLAVPAYDLILAYRHANLAHFLSAGAQHVELLRSWFIPERNHPVKLSGAERAQFESDVVFVGHFEADGRAACLEEIVKRGFRLRLFGPEWGRAVKRSSALRSLGPVKSVSGEEYNQAMAGTKVALCFFSKLNRDTYTRRCFEIPATRTMMLSEYSEDVAGLFRESVEAEYFRSRDEMLDKLYYYTTNETQRCAIAEAGYRRVYADGHDVVSRMRQVNDWVGALRQRA